MRKTILMASCVVLLNLTPAYALIPNGDFETGDLTSYSVQEELTIVSSSSLVKNSAISSSEHVGEINSGFTSNGVTRSALIYDFGTLPSDVQDLFFDIRFLDVGADVPPLNPEVSVPKDTLFASLSYDFTATSILRLTSSSISPSSSDVGVESLSNGFYRVKTDISDLGGKENTKLTFRLFDNQDERLSRVQVDNIDITTVDKSVVPEPATMFLMSGGLLGFGYLRKKKLV